MSESASHHASATSGIPQPHGGLGIFRLVTTVITLIVGGGVFTLAGDQAAGGASGAAILTAWSISGIGVLCLVMTFFALSRIKPQLKGGIYSYANAGFGDFLGFNSAWGYWISALLCTVSFSALLFGALSYFFPIFGGGTNLPSVIGASLLIWFYVFLVSRGIKEATGVNAVITISKFVPIFVAITAIIFLQKFDLGIFLANMSQGADPGLPFFDQVSNTMMITIWVFVGIEGAVAISGRAKKERDVGKATIIAFICVLSIYLMVSVLSMGVMPLSELAQLENPALAGVMEHAVGQWGAILINGGVVLSLVGAMLGYTVLSSESPYEAAEQGVFIKAFAKTNKKGAPIVTLVVTNVIIDEDNHYATVVVPDDQLSLAIGKEGQNARLAARLTGWHIDIKSASFTGESLASMDNMLIDEDEAADDEAGLCAYVGEDGVRCRNHARPGSRYCGVHADLDEA